MKYIIVLYFILTCSIYGHNFDTFPDMFIENTTVLDLSESGVYNEKIIYDYFYERKNVYVVINSDSFRKEIKIKLNNKFPNLKFIGRFRFWIYSTFFKRKVILYAKSEKLIEYAVKKKLKYVRIVPNFEDITENELLSLKDKYGGKIIIASKEKANVPVYKDLICVIDGDTVSYNGLSYRLLGFDAPEKEQECGKVSKSYLISLIKNSKSVTISPFEYDIYGRILAHLFIDGSPVAYYMIKNNMAKETVTKYGDSGFPLIADNIVSLSRGQGRLSFTSPSVYRKNSEEWNTNELKAKTPRAISSRRKKIQDVSSGKKDSVLFNITPDMLMSNKKD